MNLDVAEAAFFRGFRKSAENILYRIKNTLWF